MSVNRKLTSKDLKKSQILQINKTQGIERNKKIRQQENDTNYLRKNPVWSLALLVIINLY